MITVKKLVPYEKSYENELFDQAVIAFIAAEIAHDGMLSDVENCNTIDVARAIAKKMMDAR